MPDDVERVRAGLKRLWKRRGKPNWQTLAGSYESAARVMERKGLWMVEYLRGRRDRDTLTGFYRRQHLAERRAHIAGQEGE